MKRYLSGAEKRQRRKAVREITRAQTHLGLEAPDKLLKVIVESKRKSINIEETLKEVDKGKFYNDCRRSVMAEHCKDMNAEIFVTKVGATKSVLITLKRPISDAMVNVTTYGALSQERNRQLAAMQTDCAIDATPGSVDDDDYGFQSSKQYLAASTNSEPRISTGRESHCGFSDGLRQTNLNCELRRDRRSTHFTR